LVPLNWPTIACVMLVGGWTVREYKNMFEVVAIFKYVRGSCAASRRSALRMRMQLLFWG
jgi:hypothetical protein